MTGSPKTSEGPSEGGRPGRIMTPKSSVTRFPLFLVLRLALAVALMWFVVARSSPGRVWNSIPQIRPLPLIEALFLYAALQLLSSYKWGLILRSQSADPSRPQPSFRRLVCYYYMAMFANLFFPSSIGGDTLRTVMISPYSDGIARGALSVFMERVTGFIALVTIGLGAALLLGSYPQMWKAESSGLTLQTGVLLLIVGAGACMLFFGATVLFRQMILSDRIPRWTPSRLRLMLTNCAECLDNTGRNWRLFLGIIAVSYLFQLSYVVLNRLMMESANIHLSYVYLGFFSPVMAIASFLPLTPNALGVREVTVTLLLSAQGIAGHEALLFCLANYIVMTVVSLPGAFALFLTHTNLRALSRKNRETEGSS
ncbi:MAG: flippase-like domain-containing protein [Armatimonadetes bacterium]|nr:flippase-like domain-containing protein [Armatimonadota bacterium]